jgi:ATP-binding cassette subfamily F protein uup
LLARLFTRPANVLVLDEPTNDLDIETLELLEALLQNYSGTLFLVSHDREFLDNVVTQVIAFEGNGILREYVGGYEDWVRAKGYLKTAAKEQAAKSQQTSPSKAREGREAPLRIKLDYKEIRELDELPQKIELLEREQAAITRQLGTADFYLNQPEKAKALHERFAAIEEELMNCLARWEELEAKRRLNGRKS